MTVVRQLDSLTPAQRADLRAMSERLTKKLDELEKAPTEFRRREAGEWILRVAAEIYAWSK